MWNYISKSPEEAELWEWLVEKAMAPHSSTLAWKIPWMEEPGRLQSMGSLRVGYDWATSLSLFPFMHWRRKWQPTPVFLPGESQGWGSLVGCRLWGRTESDMTERLNWTELNWEEERGMRLALILMRVSLRLEASLVAQTVKNLPAMWET